MSDWDDPDDDFPRFPKDHGHRKGRSRFHTRLRREEKDSYAAYSSDEGSDDPFADEPVRRTYAFQLARPEPPTEDESSDESVAEPLNGAERKRERTVSDVWESRYMGSAEVGGVHAAKVTVLEGGQGKVKPLFRWIHFPWKTMNFDDFSDEISRTPGLTTPQRNAVSSLLSQVRRKHMTPHHTDRSKRLVLPSCLQTDITPTPSARRPSMPQKVTWVCLPYLSLEPYTGAGSVQTLLQAHFSKVGKERDMQQAVCRMKEAPAGHCFHIAQLWCLVVGNSLLFTCCRTPEKNLYGDFVHRELRPAPDAAGGRTGMRVLVGYRGSVMWSIPVEECRTWIRFISHFREIWPRRVVFFRHGRAVSAADWPRVWHAASRAGVTLELKIGRTPETPKGSLIAPPQEDEVEAETGESKAGETAKEKRPVSPGPKSGLKTTYGKQDKVPEKPLAIFSLLDGVSSAPDSVNTTQLAKHLTAVHHFLLRETSFGDRKRYLSCPSGSQASLYKKLEAQGLNVSSSDASDYELMESRVNAFNTAAVIFGFFLPFSAGIPTAAKFWGALEALILKVPSDDRYGERVGGLVTMGFLLDFPSRLTPLAAAMTSFAEIFRHAGPEERAKVRVPDEIVQAWIHLLMALVCYESDGRKAHGLLEDARDLLDAGLREMVMAMSDRTLLNQAVVLPMELVSLLSLQLMQNPNPGLPGVTETYLSYITSIDNDIRSRPSDRSHERHLSFIKQEVSIIQWVLTSQATVFSALLNGPTPSRGRLRLGPALQNSSYWANAKRMEIESRSSSPASLIEARDRTGNLQLMGIGVGGFRGLLLRECLAYTERIRRDFKEIRDQASRLAEYNRNKIETTKDRQERAIYAFTIVTVIFLPLSAVSSIFGMNTVDIRDMELGQWAYWATAVPVTVLVIILGLIFTGEMGNFVGWLMWRGRRAAGRYERAYESDIEDHLL